MKTLLGLLAAIMLSATALADVPALHFTGRILQRIEGGFLVQCDAWKPYLNKGHKVDEVTGEFFVHNNPQFMRMGDDQKVEFYGSPTGELKQYRTWLGGTRTVRQVAWMPAPPAAAQTTKFGQTMLDKPDKPRR